nr:head-tail adaptor protein [Hongsoonwoonella zoysiae]
MRLESPMRIEAGDGHAELQFETVSDIWVELRRALPSEQANGGRIDGIVTHRATIRTREDVSGGWRLVEGARKFRVLAVSDIARRKGAMELLLEEEGR